MTQVSFSVNTTSGFSSNGWSGPAYACTLGIYLSGAGVSPSLASNNTCNKIASYQSNSPVDSYR